MAGGWARGKHSRGICDRCGWEYAYLDLVVESGTRSKVCDSCNDGMYSLVSHPQNYPPTKLTDDIALRNPRPDKTEVVGIFVYGKTSNGYGTDYVGTFILTSEN